MDAEPPIVLPEPPATPAGLYIHYCDHEGCTDWGCFGYDGRYGTNWYCGEHREDGERKQRRA
jgi:hypothetical protein